MFIGNKNRINLKLVEEINQAMPVQLVEYRDFLNQTLIPEKEPPKAIFVNLIDVGIDERRVYHRIKEYYPNTKMVALHYYQVPKMMKHTLNLGYDAYLSIFKFSEKFYEVFKHLSINLKTG